MELASQMAGEPWGDHPACVSPLMGHYVRRTNDSAPDDIRQGLLPIVPLLIGTDAADDQARGLLAADWVVRTSIPTWLDLAGLVDHAAGLRNSLALDSWERLDDVAPMLIAAKEAFSAKRVDSFGSAWDNAYTTSIAATIIAQYAAVAAHKADTWAIAAKASITVDRGVQWYSAINNALLTRDKQAEARLASFSPTATAMMISSIDLARRMAMVNKPLTSHHTPV